MNDRTRNRVWKWSLIGLFGVAALALVAGGIWLYRHETQAIRSEKRSELEAIAELKAGQIAAWREECLTEARMNSTGIIRTYVVQWLKGSDEASLKAGILARLKTLRDLEHLQNMMLAAPDGRILLSLDSRLSVLDASAKQLVAQAVSSRDAIFGDFIRGPTSRGVHLDVAAPILDPENRPVAVLILRSDAGDFLYPFVQSWPTPSRSAETLLMRRDGDDALFLNKLRHVPDPALTLRIPLSQSGIPAVQAALGQTGAFEGRDYRGVEVLAEILPVPGSPWFMVAKEDSDEILAEARHRGQYLLLFTALSVLVTGAMAAFVFSFRQKTLYQNLYRAEESLRESQEQSRSIVSAAQDAIIMIDPQGRITLWNQSAERVFGYSAEEGLGRHLHRLLAPARFQAAHDKGFAEFLRSGKGAAVGKVLELPALHKDGREFPIELSLAPIRLHGQWHAVGVARDITERKKADERTESMLRRLEGVNQLREGLLLPGSAEDKFKRITEEAVELLDLDFCRIWSVKPSDLCSHGCIHATATEEQHVCPRRDKCLHLMASSGRYTHTDGNHRRVPIGLYKIGRVASGEDKSFLTNNVTADPRVHNHDWAKSLGLVSFAGYKLRDANGEPIGVLATFAKHPISEEDDAFLSNLAETTSKVIRDSEVQAELREKTKQALLATRAKSEFLANMSHEIRTPMTAILGYTDLLMDDSLGAADRKTFLTTVQRNGGHLLQLIDDILDLSKIEAGKMAMDLGPCHLPSMVADVASMMRPRAEQHGSTLEVRYTGLLPETIHTDGTRLRQVIVNLVGNAVKFTENGSIRIGVSFLPQWRSDQSAVRIAVTDTGIGIRPEALPRLFQPFIQAESSTTRKYGGTGLGLAISRQIVTALGGELTVESAPGKGSTFTVTIPTGDVAGVHLLESPGEVVCGDEAGARWTPGAGALRGVRILLAEDSIDNQELLRTVLGNVGAEVEVVENGRLAVERAQAGTFDVVLMDMNMPEMDGYEATRRLRDRGYSRPILALTANAMSGDCEHCLAAGCDAHLAKPIDRRQLILAVAQYAMSKTSQTDAPTESPSPAVPPGQRDGIASQFADDPTLADILPGFVERLPSQLDALCKALGEERLEDIERLAHQITGAGGSYGYPTLSEAAKSLEFAAKAQDVCGAAAALAGVKEVCAAIQVGWTGAMREKGSERFIAGIPCANAGDMAKNRSDPFSP